MDYVSEVVSGVAAFASAALLYFLKRLIGRVDENEREFEQNIVELRKDINGMGQRVQEAQLHSAVTYATKDDLNRIIEQVMNRIEEMRKEMRSDFVTTWEKLDKKADK